MIESISKWSTIEFEIKWTKYKIWVALIHMSNVDLRLPGKKCEICSWMTYKHFWLSHLNSTINDTELESKQEKITKILENLKILVRVHRNENHLIFVTWPNNNNNNNKTLQLLTYKYLSLSDSVGTAHIIINPSDTLPKVTPGRHCGLKVRGQNFFYISLQCFTGRYA